MPPGPRADLAQQRGSLQDRLAQPGQRGCALVPPEHPDTGRFPQQTRLHSADRSASAARSATWAVECPRWPALAERPRAVSASPGDPDQSGHDSGPVCYAPPGTLFSTGLLVPAASSPSLPRSRHLTECRQQPRAGWHTSPPFWSAVPVRLVTVLTAPSCRSARRAVVVLDEATLVAVMSATPARPRSLPAEPLWPRWTTRSAISRLCAPPSRRRGWPTTIRRRPLSRARARHRRLRPGRPSHLAGGRARAGGDRRRHARRRRSRPVHHRAGPGSRRARPHALPLPHLPGAWTA